MTYGRKTMQPPQKWGGGTEINKLATSDEVVYGVDYVTPNDGYVVCNSNASCSICGSDNAASFRLIETPYRRTEYVKKGMILKKYNNTNDKVNFFPFTQT